MNPQHLRAFLWLRWRLRINQLRRGGIANFVILILLAIGTVLGVVGVFFTFLLLGLFVFNDVAPASLMYVCDGLVVAFLFLWTMGLLIDLQRSEPLSLDKFLHLPVSVGGVFLINYITSLFSVTLLLFVPAALGLGLGLLFARGAGLLMVFPLLAAFILMVTALTYQFQGWLASLMVNPRRRRTIIVLVMASFILLAQLPNVVTNVLQPWNQRQVDKIAAEKANALDELDRSLAEHQISVEQAQKEKQEIEAAYQARAKEHGEQTKQQAVLAATFLNAVLPPGWFPYGVGAAAQNDLLPGLLGILGLSAIGIASLWRSYVTTVRFYRGQVKPKKKRTHSIPAPAAGVAATGLPARTRLLERQLPWISEHASAVATASFRSFLRAPESKMMLLSPLIIMCVFGSILLGHKVDPPEGVRPLMAFGFVSMMMLTMIQFMGNQFGFDRSGFRVFVLCASPRRDVLLGKNLALAPFGLGFTIVAVIILQIVFPSRWDYFLALFPTMISVFLLYALMANFLSIMAPLPMAAGSFKPTHYKGIPILYHLGFMFVFPVVLAPTLLPFGIAWAFRALEWIDWTPLCFILALAECTAIVLLYRWVMRLEGDLLQAREKRILEVVTSKAE